MPKPLPRGGSPEPRLDEHYWGDEPVRTKEDLRPWTHSPDGTTRADLRERAGVYIIEGDIVVPKAVQVVVEKWTL